MISIKNKISKPFFIMSISIPIGIFILFNLTVWSYTFFESKSNLEKVAETIQENLIKKSGKTSVFTLIRSTQLNEGTELLAFNKEGDILIPDVLENTFVTPEIARRAYNDTKHTNKSVSFALGSQNFHAIGLEIIKGAPSRTPKTGGVNDIDRVIYVSRGNISADFIWSINTILALISILVIIICSMICKRLAAQISNPLIKLSAYMEGIDYQTLVKLPNDESSIELYALTKKINEMNANIYNYNQKQKSFLQNASHEIRTPLMGILGYSEGIEMGVFENTKETAHLISNEAKRLTKLVSDLLVLSRAESLVEKSEFELCNIVEVISDIILLYKPIIKDKKIEFICDDSIDKLTNKEMIIVIVSNILSNAVRYAKETIVITLIKRENWVCIQIKDDGEGIEDIDKVFERFYRGTGGNFGLGLSIVHASVKALGGNINVYNQNGAVFEVTI